MSEPSPITFTAVLSNIDDTSLVRLPKAASEQLPSRGQVAVLATVGGYEVETVVEPDGRRGHWMRLDEKLQDALGIGAGDIADVTLSVASAWPEPTVPTDLADALSSSSTKVQGLWEDITPMARWEWVRWVQATGNADTRQRRVEVSVSKLDGGKRRPCCFDLASCTDPGLAKSGKLRDPT